MASLGAGFELIELRQLDQGKVWVRNQATKLFARQLIIPAALGALSVGIQAKPNLAQIKRTPKVALNQLLGRFAIGRQSPHMGTAHHQDAKENNFHHRSGFKLLK